MSYKDLPENWSHMPIVGAQHTADVLDIFVGMQNRMNGGVFLLLCDDQRRPLQPIMISDNPDGVGPRPAAMYESLSRIAEGLMEMVPGATALIGVARSGPLQPSVADWAWADVFTRAFADRVEIVGIHLITPRGSMPMESAAGRVA